MYFKVITLLLLCVGIIINCKAQVKTKIFKEEIPTQLIPINKMLIPEKVISAQFWRRHIFPLSET